MQILHAKDWQASALHEGRATAKAIDWCSSFTSDELGLYLPDHFLYEWNEKHDDFIGFKKEKAILVCGKYLTPTNIENPWYCDYHIYRSREYPRPFVPVVQYNGDTEANARAKMLIHLIENKIINVEELG